MKLLNKLVQRRYTIDQSDAVQDYLNSRHAFAATFLDGGLLLRKDARHTEVLEEYLHNVQHRLKMTNYMTPWQLEVHVKKFMLRHQRLQGINEADAAWLVHWLDVAQAAEE